MEKIIATATANAGVVLQIGGHRLWEDAVHNENTAHFSIVTDEMFDRLLNDPEFREPEAMLFTHAHNDHFSRQLVRKALEVFPDTQVYVEGNRGMDRQIRLREDVEEFDLSDLHLTFFRLTHDGKQFENVKHYGILLEKGDTKVLFPGDCHVDEPGLCAFLESRGLIGKIDLAFFNFPWVALNTGRAGIEKIGAKHCVFYHLPYEGDDSWGYRRQVFKMAQNYAEGNDWRVFGEPFQKEIFE